MRFTATSFLFLGLLSGCGAVAPVAPSSTARLISYDQSTPGCAVTVYQASNKLHLGESYSVKIKPVGKPPFLISKATMKYIPDASGGMQVAPDSQPLVRLVDKGYPTLDASLILQRSYALDSSGTANAELNYVQAHPGGETEILAIQDAEGTTFNCQYQTKLYPAGN